MTSWSLISQSYARYVGIPQFCLGILGNLLNVWIFSRESTYRKVPSTFYLLMASAAGIVQIMSGQIPRFLILGFNNDLTRTSLVWCKCRQFLIATFGGIGMTFQCLSVIDQFLVTSRHVRIRQFSNIKSAHHIVVGVIIVWVLQGIPFLVFNQIQAGTCIINNRILNIYWSYVYFLGLLTAASIIVMITFGILAYRNMHLLKNTAQLNHADQQLTIMICMQIFIVFISVASYGGYNVYALATASIQKDAEQKGKDLVALTVTSLSAFLNYGSSFYVFFLSSNRFRRQTKKHVCFCCGALHRVTPTEVGLSSLAHR
ncbi:unnamed protein product [Adineta steineri]|uniref:G-protein coupled receptors family 1 profile domain-containing protein n=2 Tax=Adineta steineri TaxID=433720 RepID=A0A819RH29_9BILA|nr:unnamed protein product [Adineta steineri]CAF4040569.1 unnamed protein product [Adineta steineri]